MSNRIRDELRRQDARPQHEAIPDQMPAADPSPLEAAVGQQLFSRYEQALDTLDAAEREAVIARLELGCSYQEIATLIDRPSADAARMFVARILAKLATRMTDKSPNPG